MNFIRSLKNLRRFSKLASSRKKIVFYSEHESYWKYLGPVIEHIVQKCGHPICYLSSSISDPLLVNHLPDIEAFYIGSGVVRTVTFASMKAGIIIMTTPGLGATYIRRSPHPVHYVFMPHAIVSTHMAFPAGSYDHFDTIFCVGSHHYEELREAEKIFRFKSRNLVQGGYVWLDTLMSKRENNLTEAPDGKLQIMIAPTWGGASMLEHDFDRLAGAILTAGHKIVFRPHRDSARTNKSSLHETINKFGANPNFIHGSEAEKFENMCSSHLLVSDWSGAALSFSFGLERPVLFVDTPKKINNVDFSKYQSVPLEVFVRNKIGPVIAPVDFDRAPEIIDLMHKETSDYSRIIRAIRDEFVYQTGNSASFAGDYLLTLADKISNGSDIRK